MLQFIFVDRPLDDELKAHLRGLWGLAAARQGTDRGAYNALFEASPQPDAIAEEYGGWTQVWDMCGAVDGTDKEVAGLSRRTGGWAVLFMIDDTVGGTVFVAAQGGRVVRRIEAFDDTTEKGEPFPWESETPIEPGDEDAPSVIMPHFGCDVEAMEREGTWTTFRHGTATAKPRDDADDKDDDEFRREEDARPTRTSPSLWSRLMRRLRGGE